MLTVILDTLTWICISYELGTIGYELAEVELECAVYGEGTVFPVKIKLDAKVSALQEAIADILSTIQHFVPPRLVTLYLAKKNGAWLKSDRTFETFLKQGRQDDSGYEKMIPNWTLDDEDYFGDDFQPGYKEIHILVELPEAAAEKRSGLWLVRGSIANALRTKGVRCRLYRLAGSYLGYYDPARRTGDKDSALWYEDKTLFIHVLFETKDNALLFDNSLQDEPLTLGSPLYHQEVMTNVTQVNVVPTQLQRIYFAHYDSQESESPQDTISFISVASTDVTIVDASTEEFRYQRIEHERYFLPYGKAESCHLVSKKKCQDDKREYGKYNRDTNNRLALSREMHGFYDGLSYQFPIVTMIPGAAEQNRSIGNRYKVDVFVKVLDAQCKDRVFSRLKEGAIQTEDPLVMKTFVHVEDPETFCFCMRWKNDDNEESWRSAESMTPVVE